MRQCNCETPTIIINKNLPYFVLKHLCTLSYQNNSMLIQNLQHYLWLNRSLSNYSELYDKVYLWFSKEFEHIRHSTFYYKRNEENKKVKYRIRSPFIDVIESTNTFTLVDTETGEIEDIFQLCECGHCNICTNRRRNTWAIRAELECQSHPFLPYFITLTYDNASLPPDGELQKQDLNLFIHRFRKNLKYKYNYTSPFRILKCGEYGPVHGRPHYHILVWFDEPIVHLSDKIAPEVRDRVQRKAIYEVARMSWSKLYYEQTIQDNKISSKLRCRKYFGFIYVEQCLNSKAGSYLGKYLTKSSCDNNPHIKSKQVKPFLIGSRKGGCLAKPFLMSLRDDFLNLTPGQDLLYKDRHKNISDLLAVPLNKWVINTLIPSVSRLLDKSVRDTLLQFQHAIIHLQKVNHIKDSTVQLLTNSFVIPIFGHEKVFCLACPSPLSNNDFKQLRIYIASTTLYLRSLSLDIPHIQKVIQFRDKYLAFYFSNTIPLPITDQKDKILRHNSVEYHRNLYNDCQ